MNESKQSTGSGPRRLVVVTGGNSGIGRATVAAFARDGADVVVMGRNAETLASLVAEFGPTVHAVQGDVGRRADRERLVAEVGGFGRRVDVLFANAGIARPAPFEQVDERFVDEHLDTNVKGLFFTVQAVLPLLTEGSSVILTATTLTQHGAAGMTAYAASKGAVSAFGRALAAELAPRGIRVNVVSPGPIETPIYGRMGMPQEVLEGFGREVIGRTQAKRFGRPEEVAGAVVFLASPAASYVHGQELFVDGGFA